MNLFRPWKSNLLVALVSVAAATAAAATETGTDRQWQFDVLLDDKRIGYHRFNVSQEGERQILETEARFDVKFLFVTAFRYRHENREMWSNDCLASIDATTNSNGKALLVQGNKAGDQFDLSSSAGPSTLSGCVKSFAYWNPAVLDSEQLLNSQTGEYEDITVNFEQRDQVLVGDETVDALRYRLSAKAGNLTLWYSSADNTWIGLEAPAKGGRKLLYRAVEVPKSSNEIVRVAKRQ